MQDLTFNQREKPTVDPPTLFDDTLTPSPDPEATTVLPSSAPDGGLRAWLQVFACHLLIFNTWGYINSFGIFQSHYTKLFSVSPSSISWIGSLQIFLVYSLGTFSGRLTDAGHFHTALLFGATLKTIGIFTSSLTSRYAHLILAQGICQGLGDGLVFCPAVALLSTYFERKRSLAIALMASGAATGGAVFPLMARELLDRVGFAWTVRAMGFVVLFNFAVAASLARQRIAPRKAGPLVEWGAFKEWPFVLFTLGMFFNLWAVYFAFYYIAPFAQTELHASSQTSLVLLLILNSVGLPGRVLPALIADHLLNPLDTLLPITACCSLLLFSWPAVRSLSGLFGWAVVYGFFAGAVQSLFPAACSALTQDLSKMGTRVGMVFSIVSLACLTGPPVVGTLVQVGGGRYLTAQMFGGACFAVGSILLGGAREKISMEILVEVNTRRSSIGGALDGQTPSRYLDQQDPRNAVGTIQGIEKMSASYQAIELSPPQDTLVSRMIS
ncbi:MAG: hypothetical protein M1814_006329 [Vezdaea aestivalis]|nr:MAG: hypothetical protein M1814_006329 [Vezdaea aestivalis]